MRDSPAIREAVPPPQWASRSRISTDLAPAASAALAAITSPLNVQNPAPLSYLAWWRPLDSDPATPSSNAARAAATAPPLDARTIGHSPASQLNPCDSAKLRGWPVSTARTYPGSWTSATRSRASGAGSVSSMSGTGDPVRESATHLALRVVSKAYPQPTYSGL